MVLKTRNQTLTPREPLEIEGAGLVARRAIAVNNPGHHIPLPRSVLQRFFEHEVVVALAQLQRDHDPLGPLATSEHDFELTAETRALSADTADDVAVDAPVADVVTADAQSDGRDHVDVGPREHRTSARPVSTSAWFVPQARKRVSLPVRDTR